MKKCTICGEIKSLDDYHALKTTRDRRRSACKVCTLAARRRYYDNNSRVPVSPSGHPCEECGSPVPPRKVGGAPRKFCSRPCAVRANARVTRGRQRFYQLARYGLTPGEYEALRVTQSDRCAICDTADPGTRSGTWHVDHDHSSSAVRGLLCTRCNIGLGQFLDDIVRLAAAIDYLKAHAA